MVCARHSALHQQRDGGRSFPQLSPVLDRCVAAPRVTCVVSSGTAVGLAFSLAFALRCSGQWGYCVCPGCRYCELPYRSSEIFSIAHGPLWGRRPIRRSWVTTSSFFPSSWPPTGPRARGMYAVALRLPTARAMPCGQQAHFLLSLRVCRRSIEGITAARSLRDRRWHRGRWFGFARGWARRGRCSRGRRCDGCW